MPDPAAPLSEAELARAVTLGLPVDDPDDPVDPDWVRAQLGEPDPAPVPQDPAEYDDDPTDYTGEAPVCSPLDPDTNPPIADLAPQQAGGAE